MRFLVILTLLFPFYVHADDEPQSLADVAEAVTQSMNSVETFLVEFMQLNIDCEFSGACMFDKVKEYAADESKPSHEFWVSMFEDMDGQYEDMVEMDKKCNVAPAAAVKKLMATCMQKGLDAMPEKGLQAMADLETCMLNEVKPLADAGNVFAIYAMIDIDEENAQNWQTKLEAQKDSEFYELAKQCQTQGF